MATQNITYHGSCLCGEIHFEVQAEPIMITRCHCWNCRKFTGSAFQSNIVLPAETFKFTKGEEKRKSYCDSAQDSGKALYRQFCKDCGSSLIISRHGDTGSTTAVSPPKQDGDEPFFVAVFYSALDYKVKRVEEGGEVKEVKEKIDEVPTIEFHVRDRLGWVEPLEGAKQIRTKPGAE